MKAKKIASCDSIAFWHIGSEVYRTNYDAGLDTDGLPLGKRWEASFEHWNRYRAVFAWAQDVNG